ncbi:uncharacterized protein A1O9_05958 [Exophiala aquamarina CBS 119918]|uniref:Major facilitator superfamily (MFS) profile domain-containing protein n=1 Tax=Exophiala aquamarina CBS 119918 TaxID=1182545 RepID=A0A072PR74_9EURO|nr:uncharacterized protein A1O9_05958 [Exophiala aquamarina CBS 119918]KEF58035.1 hypothetical protein A1O9_05958 [Exophiala aquamarina CBS 119918]
MNGAKEAVDEAANNSHTASTPVRGYTVNISHDSLNPIVACDDKVADLDARKCLSQGGTSAFITSQHDDEKPKFPAPGPQEITGALSSAPALPLIHEVLFVAIVCLAQLCTQVSFGQVLFILPVIGESFSLSDESELSWLVAGYSLTVGTFILISGRFGDVFGYKRMLIIGYGWFALWTMICGLSVYSNHILFIFARVLQGVGPAIILPNGLALFGAFYPPGPRKNMAFALFGACAPGGGILGGASAAVFALAWWPWTFWSLALIIAIITVSAIFIVPDPQASSKQAPKQPKPSPTNLQSSLWEMVQLLDLAAAAVGITALVLFNLSWNQAPIVGWQQPYVYVTLIISALLVPLFFYIEFRVSKNPLLPLDAFTSDTGFVLGCIACGWSSFGIFILYFVKFCTTLRHATPLQTVAWGSPVAVSGGLASVATGLLLNKLGPAPVLAISMFFFTIGNLIIATTPVHQTYWAQTFVCAVVIPWGMDMSFPAATIVLSNAVGAETQGIAASLVNTIVNYSISLGLGFAGTVEVHVNRGGRTPSDLLYGYRSAWYLGIGCSGLGLLVSLVFLMKKNFKGGTGQKGVGL